MNREFIPFHKPSIGEEEIREVEATLRSGWLTTGPRTTQFENEFKAYVRANHSLAVSSATAGLHLALVALGIGPGDEVITTPITFCSTVHTILHAGARPVLADIGPDGNLDPDSILERVTDRTRAIIPVHIAGFPCNLRRICQIARRYGLHVIEDAAHAAGTHYAGYPIGASRPAPDGNQSDAVVFSFYATKNLTTGEGGMVTTPHAGLADKMRTLCLHGTTRDAWSRYSETGSWYYEVVECGYKYNLSDIQSAIGIHQLRKLEGFIRTRTRYAHIYNEYFADLEELECPVDDAESRHAWHLYILRLNLDKLSVDRREFIQKLHALGIGTSVHFIPIPLHPFFKRPGVIDADCPRALEWYPRIVSLPLYPGMTEEQVHYVAGCVRDIARAGGQFSMSVALHKESCL